MSKETRDFLEVREKGTVTIEFCPAGDSPCTRVLTLTFDEGGILDRIEERFTEWSGKDHREPWVYKPTIE